GSDGGNHRELGGLGLLAAEPPAHAARFDGHRMAGDAERMGHEMLDLAWMLGRAMDGDVLVLSRHGQRHLSLEVEMFLTADLGLVADAARGGLDGRARL